MIKKYLKVLSISFSLFLLLILILVLFVTSTPGESILKGWLQSKLSNDLGLPVSIHSFETNLWTRVVIDTLKISSVDDSTEQPLFFVGKILVEYSIFDMLDGGVRLKNLAIDSVTIAITLDSLNQFGIPFIDTPSSDSEVSTDETAMTQIDNISIKRLGLSYFDDNLPISVVAFGAVMSAHRNDSGIYSGHLIVSHVSALYDNLNMNIKNIEFNALINNNKIQIENTKAEIDGLNIESKGEIYFSDSQAINLLTTIEGSLETLSAKCVEAFGLPLIDAGKTSITLLVDGTLDNPHIAIDGIFNDLSLPNVAIDSTRIIAQYLNNQVILDTLYLSMLGGTLNGYGIASFDSLGKTSLVIQTNSLSFSELWQAVYNQTSPYNGTLNGTINTFGSGTDWTSWTFDANIIGEHLQYENKTIPDLLCTARFKSGISNWSIVHGVDEVSGDLVLKDDTLQGTFNLSIPDVTALARFFGQTELSGKFQTQGTIAGTILNPSIDATVYGSKILYQNFPIDTLSSTFSYMDSNLIVGNLVCEGKAEFFDSERQPFGLDSISGSIEYKCQLSGSVNNPNGTISVTMNEPRYSVYTADSLGLKLVFDSQLIALDYLTINHEHVNARTSAKYNISTGSGAFDLELYPQAVLNKNNDTSIDSTKIKTDYGTITGNFVMRADSTFKANIYGNELWLGLLPLFEIDTTVSDGELGLELTLEGPYLTPNAVLDARIESLSLSGYLLDSVVSHLRLDHYLVTLDSLVTYAQGQSLRATGELGLELSETGMLVIPDSAPIKMSLDVNQFDIEVLKEMVLPEGDISGSISASLQMSGTTLLPHFDGWVKASNGRFQQDKNSSPIDNISMSLTFEDSVIIIDSIVGKVSNIPVEASGTIISSDYRSMDINLHVGVGQFGKLGINGLVSKSLVNLKVSADTLNLTVFEPMMPSLDSLSGRLKGEMQISGQLDGPLIDGTMTIDSLSFQLADQSVKLSSGHASIKFDKSRVILDSLSARINGGRLIMSGAIEHDLGNLTDISLSLRANNIKLEEPENYKLFVDSVVLAYSKQQETYVLDGDLILGETYLTKGFRATAVLPWVQGIETVEMELPELIARSRLNIRVRESNQLWIDNNLAHIRLRSEIGIIGTPVRPNLTGLIRIEEGYLLYLDRRFQVNEGFVYFNDPSRFNPDIKLDASTQITVYRRTNAEPYTIFIKAEGLLDQLQYGLFSQPSLEKPDIVALLTLGATRTELTNSDENGEKTGLTQVLKDRAALMTSKKVSSYLSRRAGSLFGFDEFTIQGNLFRFDETWGPQLIASKHLSKKINLTYSTTVGHLNDQSMRLGYRLTPRWSLQGETDRQGRAGFDLKYGITFK